MPINAIRRNILAIPRVASSIITPSVSTLSSSTSMMFSTGTGIQPFHHAFPVHDLDAGMLFF